MADEFDQYKSKPQAAAGTPAQGDNWDQYKVGAPTAPEQPSTLERTLGGIGAGLKNLTAGNVEQLINTGQATSDFAQKHPVLNLIPGVSAAAGAYKTLYSDPTNAAVTHIDQQAAAHGTQNSAAVPIAKAMARVPLIGPMALNLGEKAAGDPKNGVQPDVAGALAEGGTYAAAPELAKAGIPALAEPLKSAGARLVDRTAGSLKSDFSHGAQPGRAYLEGGGTPALTMRSLANKAGGINENTGAALSDAYRNASGSPIPLRRPIAALPAAPTVVPLGEAPAPIDVPGELIPARAMSRGNIVGPGASPNYENVLNKEVGSIAGATPARAYRPTPFVTAGTREAAAVPSGPSGPGVMITRDPAVANQLNPPPNQPYVLPRPQMSGIKIPASAVREAVSEPVNRLKTLQEGPGGTGVAPSILDYENRLQAPINAAEQRGGFTPQELFDEMKRPIGKSARWNDPTMFDLNSVRQQTTGRLGGLLTDAVPETAKLNKIYQGTENLSKRAAARADTGSSPLTTIGRRAVEGALGAGFGMASGNPVMGAAVPMMLDSVPGKTGLAYGLFQGGRAAPLFGRVPRGLLVPLPGSGGIQRVDETEPDDETNKKQ